MKYLFSIITLTIAFFIFNHSTATAQKPPKKATLNIEVSGVCGMCERRINNVLDVKGVLFSSWDRNTQQAEIIYNPRKITEQEVHELIAAVGHDTEKVKADSTVYAKLPGCCLYRDGVKVHTDK